MTATADGKARTEAPHLRAGAGVAAAIRAIERNTLRIDLPYLGTVRVLSPERLAFYGGLATIATLGIIEWPVAAVLAAGHLLAEDHHNRLLQDFGKALEEA